MENSPEFRELMKAFERNRVFPHLHSYDLFRNWLEAVWAFCEAYRDPEGYRNTLDRYTAVEGAEFARIMGVYTDAVEKFPFRDILGELFMRLDVHSARAGQFFTPWPVALMMAQMQFDRETFEAKAREAGAVTVCDPAVGSGVMLLAFASVVHAELGWTGVGQLRLYGQDIDQRCVLMCRIQIRFNGLDEFGRIARLSTALGAICEAAATGSNNDAAGPGRGKTILDSGRPGTCTGQRVEAPHPSHFKQLELF